MICNRSCCVCIHNKYRASKKDLYFMVYFCRPKGPDDAGHTYTLTLTLTLTTITITITITITMTITITITLTR